MNENGNNNQNNNYNIYNTMNDDAFNVFNQSSQNVNTTKPVEGIATPQPTQPVQQAPVAAPAPAPTPQNLVTVNDYKEPKQPFSFKNLLKKKIEEDEKTYSIDDITSFKDTSEKVDEEEVKEKKKKIKDIIILVAAVIVLIIAIIVAYNVFTNYLLPNQNIVDTSTINKNINSKKVINNTNDIAKYNCNYVLDDTFYNLPAKEYIIWEFYKGSSSYSFLNDKLDIMEEHMDISYNLMDDETKKMVIKYCNSYNKILDQYQFLCRFTDNHLLITNIFNLNKIDENVSNVLGEYNLKYNKNNILGDVITSNTACTLEK